ncbi:MAG: hypothetical protein QOC71_91 [Thermoplasmata archaeon]|jgi:MYXO-CTERM domain-containing protein|nr:hypothetical protein [Thermoplasmata archaeon]
MKTAGAVAVLLLTVLAVPATQAQDPPQGVTLAITPLAAPIPYAGAATLPVDVTVGCASILETMASNMGAAVLSVVAVGPPAWLTVAEATFDLADTGSPAACTMGTPTGFLVHHFDIGLAVTKDAPGVVDHTVQFQAALGDATGPATAVLTVAYHVNYTIVADAKFPLTVNGTEASFNITITQASNARSMVMIEKAASTSGVFSGVPAVVYENDAGKPVSKTYKATFKAPDGEWSNATATFTGFGHYLLLDGRAGEFGEDNCKKSALAFPVCDEKGTTVTYAFVAGPGAGHVQGDGDQKSPAPVGAFVALGLVALAALVRRRD